MECIRLPSVCSVIKINDKKEKKVRKLFRRRDLRGVRDRRRTKHYFPKFPSTVHRQLEWCANCIRTETKYASTHLLLLTRQRVIFFCFCFTVNE